MSFSPIRRATRIAPIEEEVTVAMAKDVDVKEDEAVAAQVASKATMTKGTITKCIVHHVAKWSIQRNKSTKSVNTSTYNLIPTSKRCMRTRSAKNCHPVNDWQVCLNKVPTPNWCLRRTKRQT